EHAPHRGPGPGPGVPQGQRPGPHGRQVVEIGAARGDSRPVGVGGHEAGQDSFPADHQRVSFGHNDGAVVPWSRQPVAFAEDLADKADLRLGRDPGMRPHGLDKGADVLGHAYSLTAPGRVAASCPGRPSLHYSVGISIIAIMVGPGFLDLPARSVKPRGTGITHVLDRGLPLGYCADLLESAGAYVDVWKFGWGISYLDQNLPAKLELLARHRVLACPGGTLLEIAWAQGRATAFFDWARASGVPCALGAKAPRQEAGARGEGAPPLHRPVRGGCQGSRRASPARAVGGIRFE